jgi:hypothetical protein
MALTAGLLAWRRGVKILKVGKRISWVALEGRAATLSHCDGFEIRDLGQGKERWDA